MLMLPCNWVGYCYVHVKVMCMITKAHDYSIFFDDLFLCYYVVSLFVTINILGGNFVRKNYVSAVLHL